MSPLRTHTHTDTDCIFAVQEGDVGHQFLLDLQCFEVCTWGDSSTAVLPSPKVQLHTEVLMYLILEGQMWFYLSSVLKVSIKTETESLRSTTSVKPQHWLVWAALIFFLLCPDQPSTPCGPLLLHALSPYHLCPHSLTVSHTHTHTKASP